MAGCGSSGGGEPARPPWGQRRTDGNVPNPIALPDAAPHQRPSPLAF